MISDNELIKRAKEVAIPKNVSSSVEVASVGAAIVTDKGNIYVGVCIDVDCGIGFCAEHNAIGSMVTNGESKIVTIVAVDCSGVILPPCGRCREFIYQLDPQNPDTRVLMPNNSVSTIKQLLPEHWMAYRPDP